MQRLGRAKHCRGLWVVLTPLLLQAVALCSVIVEPMAGFEPATSSLPRKCSTPELHRQHLERKTRLKLATLSLEG